MESTARYQVSLQLIGCPGAGGDQLHRMIVGIAEVQARASAIPGHLAFDLHAVRREVRFPARELLGVNCKRQMDRPASIVRWDKASISRQAGASGASLKKEQHADPIDAQRTQAGRVY